MPQRDIIAEHVISRPAIRPGGPLPICFFPAIITLKQELNIGDAVIISCVAERDGNHSVILVFR